MSVLWIEVPDESGPNSARAYIERNAIGLLSHGLSPVDKPSVDWLGLHSPNSAISRSGLWNLDLLEYRYEPRFLDLLEDFVARTCSR
jgi:hypothetical protein